MVMSDTAANMKNAFKDENWGGCFEHVLALSVNHSIFSQSGVKLVIKKVKVLIKKMRTPTGVHLFHILLKINWLIVPCWINADCRTHTTVDGALLILNLQSTINGL
jgi:hypothetical protein